MINSALFYGPQYANLGTTAVLTLGSGPAFNVTAIDATEGVEIERGAERLVPGAYLRMEELAGHGVAAEDLDGGQLDMNDRHWRIQAHRFDSGPEGIDKGEVVLILEEI